LLRGVCGRVRAPDCRCCLELRVGAHLDDNFITIAPPPPRLLFPSPLIEFLFKRSRASVPNTLRTRPTTCDVTITPQRRLHPARLLDLPHHHSRRHDGRSGQPVPPIPAGISRTQTEARLRSASSQLRLTAKQRLASALAEGRGHTTGCSHSMSSCQAFQAVLILGGTEPRDQLNSIRLRPPPAHICNHRQEDDS
jgi:hypothetical protein